MLSPYDACYLAFLGLALAEVGVELAISRGNELRLRAAGYREVAPWVFRAMVPVYLMGFVAGPWERFGRSDRGAPWILGGGLLAALVAGKALKVWVIATLRGTWTKKVFVKEGMAIRTDGPFAYVRHPNYVAMVPEIAAIGFAGGTPVTGTVLAIGFGTLLVLRIATEERALEAAADYRRAMRMTEP